MYHLKDSVHLDLTLDDYEVPTGAVTLGKLLLTSDTVGAVPLMQLEIADDLGQLKLHVDFIDGMKINLKLGRSEDRQKEYKFRLFNCKEVTQGTGRYYRLFGYLDLPAYFGDSSNKVHKGVTSKIIKDIVEAQGLKADKFDTTADNQTWYQANMRHCEFVKYLMARGYVDEGSVMIGGITFDNRMLYKDFNRISGEEAVFSMVPSSGKDVQVLDFRALDNTGGPNMVHGYSYKLLAQDHDKDKKTELKESKVQARAKNVAQNKEVKEKITNGRVDFTPVHHKEQVHENFFKGLHQNTRGVGVNSVLLDVLTPAQLDNIDLLTPVSVRLRGAYQTEESPDQARDGSYIVVAKHILVKGVHYCERYRLARAGTNSGKKGK